MSEINPTTRCYPRSVEDAWKSQGCLQGPYRSKQKSRHSVWVILLVFALVSWLIFRP